MSPSHYNTISFLTKAFVPVTLNAVPLLGYIVIQIAVNALAFLAADYFVPGVTFSGDFRDLIILTAILAAFNIFLRPAVKLFLGPFVMLSFGLILVVVNGAVLWFASMWVPTLTFATPLAVLEAALIFTVGNFAIYLARKAK
jgi:uncharacterized membrane protein YvlD (DUF360 family)